MNDESVVENISVGAAEIPRKRKRLEFFIVEFCVFASQFLVIFLVAYFISDMLQSEERLASFADTKVNSHTISELGLTLFAVTFVLGVLYILRGLAPTDLVERIAEEVISELPRTIYLFGSSIAAITCSIAVFLAQNPKASELAANGFFVMSAFFAVSFFGYGYLLKSALASKRVRK